MKIKIGIEGNVSSSISINGGIMLGALILANDPSQPLEAATKHYVDTTFANLNANNVISGILPISSLPSFTGDATSSQGTNVINLSNLGITPGTYAKIIVDAKGRVIGNDILSSSDIPKVSWNKIQNKPNTLSDYGITDALSITGGTINSYLTVQSPTQGLSIVNKQYVDNTLSGNLITVGDIIRKPYPTTPPGFLKCNGALVDKTTYANLYAVIGDNFRINNIPGSGKPWQQQYQINTNQATDITGWVSDTPLPGPLGLSQAIVTSNRVYLLGGYNGSVYVNTVYTAPINADGTLGTWVADTPLPGALGLSQAIVTKNRVYLLGGWNGNQPTNIVYTAPINADGTLGAWSTGTPLPGILSHSQAVVTKNRVYLLGGHNGGAITNIVYTAPINPDGTLGAWSTGTPLPGALDVSQAIVTKNRVYLLGGYNGTQFTNTVYTAPINVDGTLGTWTTGTPLPGALGWSQAIITKNRVYLLGGHNGYNFTNAVYTAPINADGTLGAWSTGTPLPGALGWSQAIFTSNKVYLIGGVTNTNTVVSTVYSANISGALNDYSPYYDGTIQSVDNTNLFALPDLTIKEKNGQYYYIKY